MPARKKTRDDDKRGCAAGDPDLPRGKKRAGTELEGRAGNAPHERNEGAAKLIETLKGFGLTTDEISLTVERQYDDQGYSKSTLERHYADELARGMAAAKATLLQRANMMAMGKTEGFPQGTSPDKIAEISSRKTDFLLRVVHGVGGQDLGSGTVTIHISPDDEEL